MMTSPLSVIFYVVILFRLRLSSVGSISLEAGDGVSVGGRVYGIWVGNGVHSAWVCSIAVNMASFDSEQMDVAQQGGGYIPRVFS
jgi:hypothetical protein